MKKLLSLNIRNLNINEITHKFIEKYKNDGNKWLTSCFKNHDTKVKRQAEANSMDFIIDLTKQVKSFMEKGEISQEQINNAQNQPDFSIILQNSLLNAAQTESKEKHKLLARLIAERLKAKPESMLSLASKMASDIIPLITINQLKLLGLLANIFYCLTEYSTLFEGDHFDFLIGRLHPYAELEVKNDIDLLHLETLSCIKRESLVMIGSLNRFIVPENNKNFYVEEFYNTDIGKKILNLWNNHRLETLILTTTGKIIGIYVSDLLANSTTRLKDWYGNH